MSFRTVVVKNRCKLEFSLNYLVCRKVDEEKRVLISEIDFLIIMNQGVAMTTALITALIENKVRIIFCDSKSNPCGEITPYQNHFASYKKIKEQIVFSKEIKDSLWKQIVKQKIFNQAKNLQMLNASEYNLLMEYYENVTDGDVSNREGHAAKVYFNSLFGNSFSRDKEIDINKYLNYGYSIILSAINREVKICGYLTEIGIHHIGETNPFNMSCDFIEPLRPLIDLFVINNKVNEDNFKEVFINLLNYQVNYNNCNMFLENAIKLYVQTLFKCLVNNSLEGLKFIEYEL